MGVSVSVSVAQLFSSLTLVEVVKDVCLVVAQVAHGVSAEVWVVETHVPKPRHAREVEDLFEAPEQVLAQVQLL